jgi:FSR family fosmidomycin resistance protein-like MFS transporter
MLAGILLNNAHSRLNEWFSAAVGPAFPRLVEYGTVSPLFILATLAIPGITLMAVNIPARSSHRLANSATKAALPPIPRVPLIILAIAVALRAMGHLSTVTFMSYIFQLKGWSPAAYGFITGSFWVASGVSGVIFGHLGDRFDRRWVVMFSLIASAPAIYLLPGLDGALALMAAMTIGAMSGSHSLIVVMAQNMMKGRKGLASGAILGFIFASGAISTQIMGDLIERIGATSTYQIVAGLTLVASSVWLLLPKHQSVAAKTFSVPEAAPSAAD